MTIGPLSAHELQLMSHDGERAVILALLGAAAIGARVLLAWITRGTGPAAQHPAR